MPAEQGDGFNLDDRDRLPWLEPAEVIGETRPVPVQKLVALVLLGLALIGLIVGGGWWLKGRGQGGGASGEVALIAAPGGPYKIPAPDPKAREFAGEGDESYKASEGEDSNGHIDASRAPERPMPDLAEAPAPLPKPLPSPTRTPAKRAAIMPIKDEPRVRPIAPPPAPAPTPATMPTESAPVLSGVRVQLGAYNSDAIAQTAWKRLVERFAELSGANHAVEKITTGGRALYRLRMSTPSTSEASALCGKLRVAGESCWVVP